MSKTERLVVDRGSKYGHPRDNFDRQAQLWTTYLKLAGVIPENKRITREMVPPLMVLLKLARDLNMQKIAGFNPDDWLDIQGYSETRAMLADPLQGERR